MTDLSQATRPLMWNIEGAWAMYALFAVALGVFGYGLWRRVREWRRGKPSNERLGDWGVRLWLLTKELVLQTRVRGSGLPGLFHSLVFYSFGVLVVTTAVVALDYDFGTSFFQGWLYVFLTVASELAGVLVLIGIGMAFWRRTVAKPDTLPNSPMRDLLPLVLIALIVVTGFLAEGLRIAVNGDPWVGLSPVGYLASLLFGGLSPDAGSVAHQGLWWGHTVLAMGWIACLPYTKFVHLLALPTNVFFAKLRPRGELSRVNLIELMSREDADEEVFRIGLEKPADFTWKQRLDFDACISCGRCEEICPSHKVYPDFSPRAFIAKCKDLADAKTNGETLVGTGFDEEYIWHCRTCMACMEVCPACVDHVDTMIEIRRNEVLWQGRMPAEAQQALKLLENKRNPFGPQGDRLAWVKQLDVRIVKPGESVDVLYWIGCCIAFDPTKQKIAKDVCKLLQRCGVDFGILGGDEKCCGDPARVLGEERLFQEIATEQCEAIKSRSFKVILTSCPHCYNVLKNEYPQFGGNFNVVHHSEFLHEMLWAGDLKPRLGVARKAVYHDPCYIGRYQRMFEAPREVLSSLPGIDLAEMRHHDEKSFCCGGGGGHFWMDLKTGERINNLRVDQATEAGADTIVTACAYCKQMLDDSIKLRDLTDEIEVIDIASLVLESLPAEQAKNEDAKASTASA
jgi:Fe-S oxidoreductase/nitrate reductase gamma subunit